MSKWRTPLLGLTLLSIIASVIFSSPFFITPLYKSTVILYPTSTNAISKALLNESSGPKDDILQFGEDEQSEQMLQILSSNKIRDRIISKYDLIQHYRINPGSSFAKTRLYEKYEGNITFRRTENMAIKITVYDRDPQMAADIANDISDLFDSVKIQMQRQRATKALDIVKAEYEKLNQEIFVMEDSLRKLRQKGVHDYETQAEMINQQLAIEIAKGNTRGIAALENKLDTLAKYGTPYVSIRDALEHEKKQLSLIKSRYDAAKVDAEAELPQKFVVNTAYKAERKSYPVRWLIVTVSALSVFIFSLIIILIIENTRDFLRQRGLNISSFSNNPLWARKSVNPPVSGSEPNPAVVSPPVSASAPVNAVPSSNPESAKDNYQVESPKNYFSTDIFDNFNRPDIMEYFFNNLHLLKTLVKWKVHLSLIILGAILLSILFSSPLFIKPKFRSFGIAYPANLAPYSDESETEQMLQILQSKEVRDSIIKKFDLIKHYEIDPGYKYLETTLIGIYQDNVRISKTSYESVEIVVYDEDPKVACDIVNAIIEFYNVKVRTMHKEKYEEVARFLYNELQKKRVEIDSVERVLFSLRKDYGLWDYGNQTREVARGYLRTVDGNNSSNINQAEVAKLKESIEGKGGEFILFNQSYYALIEDYNKVRVSYDEAIMNATKNITYAHVVTKPFPAEKKAYPVRWVIVLFSVLGAFMISMLTILIIEKRKITH